MPSGFHVHRAPRVDLLADALAGLLRDAPADPFTPDTVVASGRALERVARLHVADALGVCANLRVVSPSTWFADTVARLLGLAPEDVAAWEADALAWAVHAALPDALDDPHLAPVRGYLRDAAPGSPRWMGLARRVAACFERYQLARPALVRAWDAGADDVEPWQAVLWRAVRERIARPHLAELSATARALLEREGTGLAAQLPARLAWLAHAGLAPQHLALFAALPRAGTAAHLLVLQPVRDAVPAEATTHPLARSLGRQSRALDTVLDACGAAPDTDSTVGDAPSGARMLAQLQRDVLDGASRGPGQAPPLAETPTDDSVRVLACHGRTRQVESLRDELLRRLDADATLEPRDVLVLVADLAAFAPIIDAVFAPGDAGSRAADEPPALAYRIVDRPRAAANDVATALLAVMRAAAGRLDAAVLQDLLALPAIAARWALDDEARELAASWLREAGARWAIDARDRERHGALPLAEHTLRFGLDRLLLGAAMPDEDALWAGVLPCEVTEGSGTALLGRVAAACEAVFDAAVTCDGARPMAEWRAALGDLLSRLASAEVPAHAWQAQAVREALDAMAEDAERAGAVAPVEASAVRQLLEARFGEAGTSGAFENGGVTFSALLPGRVAPARVVALLGMDDGVFPRERARLGFDLVARDPQPGDPDPGEDDRARFLEAILAARDALVVTYTGRSIDRNEPVPPAVPVSELLDALDATYATPVRAHVERAQPLQPFSRRLFTPGDDGAPASFDRGWAAGARRLGEAREKPPAWIARPLPPATVRDAVSVESLARWLASPSRGLCELRLAVRLDERLETIETREPETLVRGARDRYRAELVAASLDGASLDGRLALARARGVLPHGAHAEVTHRAVAEEARVVARALETLRAGEPIEPRDVDLVVAGVRISGRTGACWGDAQVHFHPGPLWASDQLAAWLRHLVLLEATRAAYRTIIVAHGDPARVTFAPVAGARTALEAVVEAWRAGQGERVPLFGDTSRAYAESRRGGGDHAAALAKAHAIWAGSDWKTGEGSRDAHAARVWSDWAPGHDAAVDDRFAALATAVWGAMLDAMEVA